MGNTTAAGSSQDIEFVLLGPLEIRIGDRSLTVSAPKRRALLAMLLLHANRIVSMDQLVEALWGGDPPGSARAQVQSLIHGVRSVLAEAGGSEMVQTCSPGYLVRIEPDQLDVMRFERSVGRAREAAAAGRLIEAEDLYQGALSLWRGPALEGVEAPFVQPLAGQLEEQRLRALEERVEVDLKLGRHALMIPELSVLVAEHPYREQLRAHLMLALYRSGRQVEALEIYRRGHELLVDELGLIPGPVLRQVEQAILTADRSLDFDASSVASSRAVASRSSGVRALASDPAVNAARPGEVAGRRTVHALVGVLAGALAIIAVATVALVRSADNGQQRVVTQRIPGPAWVRTPPVPVSPTLFGVTINSPSGTMPSFQVGAVRLWDSYTRWSNVQPGPGQFDWTVLERLVAGAERADLPVLYTIGGTPKWANPSGPEAAYEEGPGTAPPRDLADWDAFVRKVVRRYRGRIEAYELWDHANFPRFYTGTLQMLVEMTRRASRLIKAIDPRALVVCPSMGELWKRAMRDFLRRFAALRGYQYCDVAAVKLYPRHASDPPERMVALAREIHRAFHRGGTHKHLWNTGVNYNIVLEPRLGQREATNYAVRFYLVGLYLRDLGYERMYFYNWGGIRIPIVLQAVGGPPTEAARFVEKLQRWLAGARVRSCGSGTRDSLPDNVWQCRLTVPNDRGGRDAAIIRWTVSGAATLTAERGAYRLEHLDGRVDQIRSGQEISITERPVLIRYRLS